MPAEFKKRHKRWTWKEIGISAGLVGIISVGSVFLTGLTGTVWGSRGSRQVYAFTHLGRQSYVMEEDLILAPNKYYIKIDGEDERMYHRRLLADSGEEDIVGEKYRFFSNWRVEKKER